ncbi:helix-turn-helix transcriptional regulator [Streptomyces lydicus]|uniref:helix-turn-helix transcriptional regulator n=1 Tax=Streptomyces lydicus TaxID=47763 RepID=UPI003797E24A
MKHTESRQDAGKHRRALASPQEISDYLGIPVRTLYQWKYRGIGPKVHKVGKHLRYRWTEVDAWLQTQSLDLVA